MPTANRRPWLRRNVLAVGLVSLLTDASSEMVLPLLPAFLTVVLGGGPLWLAWIEGLADAVSSVLKLLAGRWSDRSGRRRPFMLVGYGLSTLARPLVAFAMAPWHVVMVRVTDRVGKGLRSSPRDALLADSVPPEHRGAAFGFHRAMDHTGAVIGPLIAVAVLGLWTTDLRTVFLLAAVPGVLAVAAIVLGVREAEEPRAAAPTTTVRLEPNERRSLVRALIPIGLFGLGRASDAFLLLYAGENRASLLTLPLLWIGLHAVKAGFSTFGGRVADRIGPARAIAIGWTVHVLAYVALAATGSQAAIAALLVIYGLHHALSEGPEKALVVALVGEHARATAFGWYHLVVGFASLGGSLVIATVWEVTRPAWAFATGAVIAGLATIVLAIVLAPRKPA